MLSNRLDNQSSVRLLALNRHLTQNPAAIQKLERKRERDLHAGGTVFIPACTLVSVKNEGTGNAGVVFVFSAPGFESYMRCDSVLPDEKVTPLSLEEQKACAHQGHVIYKDLEDNTKK